MSTLETIKSKIAEIKKQKEELTAQLRKDFAPMLKPLFDKSEGKITSIGWTQYTPYFNDGDTCEFSTNVEYSLYINGEHEDDTEGLDWRIEYYLSRGEYAEDKKDEWDIELYKLVQEFKSILSSIDDEFYKDLFGDHALVTIHANGTVETEYYEHD